MQRGGGDEEVEQPMANLPTGATEFPPDDCRPACHGAADAQYRYTGQEFAELLFSFNNVARTEDPVEQFSVGNDADHDSIGKVPGDQVPRLWLTSEEVDHPVSIIE